MLIAGNLTRVEMVALIMSQSIAVVQYVGFSFPSGATMLAESGHSVLGTFKQVFLFLDLSKSQLTASEPPPSSYGQGPYSFSFLVELLLLGERPAYPLCKRTHKIAHPPAALQNLHLNLVILVMVNRLNVYQCCVATQSPPHTKGPTPFAPYLCHPKDQFLVTVHRKHRNQRSLPNLKRDFDDIADKIVTGFPEVSKVLIEPDPRSTVQQPQKIHRNKNIDAPLPAGRLIAITSTKNQN